MKKLLFLSIATCVLAAGAFAQKASYSGTWTLDADKSTVNDRMLKGSSITLKVNQTAKQVTVDTVLKREVGNDMPAGMPRGAMGGFGGDSSNVFPLDGKESKTEVDGPNGKMPVIFKGIMASDGSMKLTITRSFNGPSGPITMTVEETWKLSADGKTLNVERVQSNPRGSTTSSLVFTKG